MSRYKWSYRLNVLGWNFIKWFLANFYIALLIVSLTDTLPVSDIDIKMRLIENSTINEMLQGYMNNVTAGLETAPFNHQVHDSSTVTSLINIPEKNKMTVSSTTHSNSSKSQSTEKMENPNLNNTSNEIYSTKHDVNNFVENSVISMRTKCPPINRTAENDVASTCINQSDTEENISSTIDALVNITRLPKITDRVDKGTTESKIDPGVHKQPLTESNTPNSSVLTSVSPNIHTKIKTTSVGDISDTDTKTIYIGGLFELTGTRSERLGLSELTSARLAIDHVNRVNFLNGYTLHLLHNDTRVSINLVNIKKMAAIGPPANRHSNGVLLAYRLWLKTGC